jgi:hypothetical protein
MKIRPSDDGIPEVVKKPEYTSTQVGGQEPFPVPIIREARKLPPALYLGKGLEIPRLEEPDVDKVIAILLYWKQHQRLPNSFEEIEELIP